MGVCEDCAVTLRYGERGCIRKDILVHQLVAWTFLGPQPEGTVIRHLDDKPENNAVANLAYGSMWDKYVDRHRDRREYFDAAPVFFDRPLRHELDQVLAACRDPEVRQFLVRLRSQLEANLARSRDKATDQCYTL